MGKYYDAAKIALHRKVIAACENIASKPCSEFAGEIDDLASELNGQEINGWSDSAEVSFVTAREETVSSLRKISSSINSLFTGGEQTYNLLNQQLDALKQADSNYATLLKNEPKRSDYQESYTKGDGTVEHYTSRRYYRVHDNWEDKKRKLEQQCTNMIENIEVYISTLKQIDGAGLDGVSINFGELPAVIGFENVQFNYNPTPTSTEEGMKYQLEYLSEEEARKLGYEEGQKVGKVMLNGTPLYFLTDDVGEDYIQSIVSDFENLPSEILKYANWNGVEFGKEYGHEYFKIYFSPLHTETIPCEFESGDCFKEVTRKLAEHVTENCNINGVINDPNFEKMFAEYLRNPELRETEYKSIDDLVTNNFEVQEDNPVQMNSGIVSNFENQEDKPIQTTRDVISNFADRFNLKNSDQYAKDASLADDLAVEILDHNGKSYTPTTYAIYPENSGACETFSSLCEKVTNAGGVVITHEVGKPGDVIYQDEEGFNGYNAYNVASGGEKGAYHYTHNFANRLLAGETERTLNGGHGEERLIFTVYTDQDLSDIPGLTKI